MKLNLKEVILSLFSALTMLLNWTDIYEIGIKSIINWRLPLIIVLSLVLLYVYKKYSYKANNYTKWVSSIFTVFVMVGNSYICFGSVKSLYKVGMLPWTFIKCIGFYVIISFFVKYLYFNIPKILNKKDLKNNKLITLFNNYPLLFSLITLTVFWSIYYIAFYPIILSPDPSFQIKQFLGEQTKYMDYSVLIDQNVTITNHHPVFHTVLLGSFAKLGMFLGNDNFGLFLYSLLQGVFMAFTLSKTICLLKEYGLKNRWLFIILAIYSLVPQFPLYAINGNKDVYYSLFVIWLFMFLFKYVSTKNEEKITLFDSLKLFIILLFICLFRNNGSYLVIILFPFLLFYKRINFKNIFIVFISVISIFVTYKNILLPSLGITGGSIREMMSVFFQQTSRYVINHEEDLTPEDINAIGKIIDYNSIQNYNPVLADPVKNTYNKYATTKDLKDYLMAWGKGLIKHPMTYIDATLNNIYGYFDPEDTNWYKYTKFDSRITNLVDYHYNDLSGLRNTLTYWSTAYPYIPVVGLISNIGFSTWIFIALTLWLLFKNKKGYLIILIPMYVSLLVCMASPVNTYFRYAMPYVFAVPFILGMWILLQEKRTSK